MSTSSLSPMSQRVPLPEVRNGVEDSGSSIKARISSQGSVHSLKFFAHHSGPHSPAQTEQTSPTTPGAKTRSLTGPGIVSLETNTRELKAGSDGMMFKLKLPESCATSSTTTSACMEARQPGAGKPWSGPTVNLEATCCGEVPGSEPSDVCRISGCATLTPKKVTVQSGQSVFTTMASSTLRPPPRKPSVEIHEATTCDSTAASQAIVTMPAPPEAYSVKTDEVSKAPSTIEVRGNALLVSPARKS